MPPARRFATPHTFAFHAAITMPPRFYASDADYALYAATPADAAMLPCSMPPLLLMLAAMFTLRRYATLFAFYAYAHAERRRRHVAVMP